MPELLIINSSARLKSNSSLLSAQVGKGAQKAGWQVESVEIGRLTIRPCLSCMKCAAGLKDYCAQKDDMTAFYPRVLKAQGLIFVSPVYWFNLGGQLKQFIDRCFAITPPRYKSEPSALRGKSVGAVFAFGGEDLFDSGGVNAVRSFQDICAYAGARWAGAVYGMADEPGEIAHNAALMAKAEAFGLAFPKP